MSTELMNIDDFLAKQAGALAAWQSEAPDTELAGEGGQSFPTLSIKGREFRFRVDGEEEVHPNKTLDVVILRANPKAGRVFYEGAYDPKDPRRGPPDCQSFDGVKPLAGVPKPQAKTCATCPQSIKGSAKGEDGKPRTACRLERRLAVLLAHRMGDAEQVPFLLRVPPASLRAVREYGQALTKYRLPPHAMVTTLSFDPDVPYPALKFAPVGTLDAAWKEVLGALRKTEEVERMVGLLEPDVVPGDVVEERPDWAKPQAPPPPPPPPPPQAPAVPPSAPPKAPPAPPGQTSLMDEVDAALGF